MTGIEWYRRQGWRLVLCLGLTTLVGGPALVLGDIFSHLEVDGNIVEGPDDQNDCAADAPADVSAAPDWSSIFTSAKGCFDEGDPDAGSQGPCNTTADCPGKLLCVPFVTGVATLPANGVVAAFVRDESSAGNLDDCNVFGRTDDKNDQPIATWDFKEGGTPPKDDISNVYAYEAAEGDDRLLYLALERPTNNGDAHIDFEINQGPIGFDPPADPNTCPTGKFTGKRCNNDLLISVDFEKGGALGGLRVFRFEGTAGDDGIFCNDDDPIPTLNTTPLFDSFAGTGVLAPDDGSNRLCYEDTADIDNDGDTSEIIICGVNSGRGDLEIDIHSGPGVSVDNHADVIDCLPANFFTEVAVNRTAFGLGGDRCLSSINAKSRSSQSITSELKDFAFLTFDTCSDIGGKKEEVETVLAGGTPDCETIAGPLQNWEIRLYDDANGDGCPGVCGASDFPNELVTTDGNGDTLSNPVFTGADGVYGFANLPNGKDYIVCEIIPATPAVPFFWDHCFPDGPDAGAERVNEFCYDPFELTSDTADKDFRNFKVRPTCDLTTLKFCDTNGNGSLDAGNPDEAPLAGFCICVTELSSATTVCGLTTGDGDFTTQGIAGETYRVVEDLTGAACTGGQDLSAEWLETTSSPLDVTVPNDASVCPAPLIGNTSRPTIDCGSENASLNNDVGLCSANYCFTPTDSNACGGVDTVCTAQTASGPVVVTENTTTGQWCGDFPAGCPETTTVTCVATTQAGQTASCSFTVTVTDNEDPALSGVPGDASGQCDDEVPAPAAVTCDDNCDGSITPVFGETDTGTCPRTVVRTWTCTDTCGNSVTDSQTITINDTTDPVLSGVPADVSDQCDADIPPVADVTCSDNCDGSIVPVFSETDIGTCPRTIVRTWTCTDACGNSVTESQTITIDDITDPVLSGVPADVSGQCNDEIPSAAAVTCSDNCDGSITPVFSETDNGTCPRTIVRTWTCTDACGNSVMASQTIAIDDTTDPVLSGVPADTTVECDSVPPPANVTCSDNCDGALAVTFSGSVVGQCPAIMTRTWSCTDACGNTTTQSQTITIVDTTDPILSGVPADVTIECDQPIPPPADVTASDNCDTDVPVTLTGSIVGQCPAVMTRTWTATDDCGNTVTDSQTITIVDTTDPILFGVPADVAVQCDVDVPLPAIVTCSDNCDPSVVPVLVEIDDGFTCPRTITRTWTCTDDCGNTVSDMQVITVDDTILPMVTCPSDTTVNCSDTFAFTATASDNCDPFPDVLCTFTDPADPDRFTVTDLGGGSYELTLTATTVVTVTCDATDDCNNNSGVCTFTVDATCDQACSPGFWRNNVDTWCSDTPFNPTQDFCEAGAPTGFLEAFGIGACPAAPGDTAIALDTDLTLHQAVSSSGGNDQTLFHCSAALLSATSLSFPTDPAGVISTVQGACDGSIGWTEAFQICNEWNKAEDDGGCPFSSATP